MNKFVILVLVPVVIYGVFAGTRAGYRWTNDKLIRLHLLESRCDEIEQRTARQLEQTERTRAWTESVAGTAVDTFQQELEQWKREYDAKVALTVRTLGEMADPSKVLARLDALEAELSGVATAPGFIAEWGRVVASVRFTEQGRLRGFVQIRFKNAYAEKPIVLATADPRWGNTIVHAAEVSRQWFKLGVHVHRLNDNLVPPEHDVVADYVVIDVGGS